MSNQLITLRREKPGAFCGIASGFLIVLAILGHIISGQWIVLIGLMVAGFISTKHQFKIVNEPKGLFFYLLFFKYVGQLIRFVVFFPQKIKYGRHKQLIMITMNFYPKQMNLIFLF